MCIITRADGNCQSRRTGNNVIQNVRCAGIKLAVEYNGNGNKQKSQQCDCCPLCDAKNSDTF